jgi:hypothetical protein
MDRGTDDGSMAVLEDGLRRSLDRGANAGGVARPPFAEIARRGRRRQRRRRDATLAGIGVAGIAVAALTWRVGGPVDGGTTTVSVASIPDEDPGAEDPGIFTDEEALMANLEVMDEWASEPVPAGCEAFAADHPGARGLREVKVGESIAGSGGQVTSMRFPYAGPGAHFRAPGEDGDLHEIIGDDGSVLYRLVDPEWTFHPYIHEAGGWVYFREDRYFDASVGVEPDGESVFKRVPSVGGPAEAVPGSPPAGDFDVSPDGRWLAVQAGYGLGPGLETTVLPSALTVVDLSSGATHAVAICGVAAGSTWVPVWADDGGLLISSRLDDFGMDCRTGERLAVIFPGPSEAGQFAVDLDRMRVYRLDPTATSMAGAEVIWPR